MASTGTSPDADGRIRVAFDTGSLHGALTGVGFATRHMHDALVTRGDVELREYVLSARASLQPGARRLPLPAALAHRLWSVSSRPRLDRWMGAVDVVHGTNYVVPPSRHPRLVTIHDVWFLRQPSAASPAVRRAGEVMRRALTTGAEAHVPSAATADVLRSLVPSATVHVIPLGPLPLAAAPDTCPFPDLEGRPFVVAIGTLERRKNLVTLVKAFATMRGQVTDLQLVIAGNDGDDGGAVRHAVDTTRTGAAVHFTGRVDGAARSWLLHRALVLAYPSLDEGFGFPLLDAMQAMVPVVASTAGSIPEVAADAALLGAPDDVDTLAANLAHACTDETERSRLVAAGALRLAHYDWATTADGLVAAYRSLIGHHR